MVVGVCLAIVNLPGLKASPPANQRPNLTLLNPAESGPLISPATFTLEALADDPDGRVDRVEFFYAQKTFQFVSLGSVREAPFRLPLKDFVGIQGILRAVAWDDQGASNAVNMDLNIIGLPGDDFNRPVTITGTNAQAYGNNSWATTQTGEPRFAQSTRAAVPEKTLWWSWASPGVGVATISTAESSFDTTLEVYSGVALANLKLEAANDDARSHAPASMVKVVTQADKTYLFRVGGASPGESGDIALAVVWRVPEAFADQPAPENDAFSNRVALAGVATTVIGSNRGATAEKGEPAHDGTKARSSVWYEWKAPQAGRLEVSTRGSGFDTVLSVYRAAADVTGLALLARNDDDPDEAPASLIALDVVKDKTYEIALDGLQGGQGDFTLRLDLAEPEDVTQPSANDAFANAITLERFVTAGRWPYRLTTLEAGEPVHAEGALGGSAWWQWQAPADGAVFLSVRGWPTGAVTAATQPFKVGFAVYRGSQVGALESAASGALQTEACVGPVTVTRWAALGGEVYRIAVQALGANTGDVELALNAKLLEPLLELRHLQTGSGLPLRLQILTSHSRETMLDWSANLLDWSLWTTVQGTNGMVIELPGELSDPVRFFRARSLE